MVKASRCSTPASIRGSDRARRRRCLALLPSDLPEDPRESQEDLQDEPNEFQEAEGATRPAWAARGSVAGGDSGVELMSDGMEEYISSLSDRCFRCGHEGADCVRMFSGLGLVLLSPG